MAGRIFDLRNDRRWEYEFWGNLGKSVGGALGGAYRQKDVSYRRKQQEDERRQRETFLVATTKRSIDENWSDDYTHRYFLENVDKFPRSYAQGYAEYSANQASGIGRGKGQDRRDINALNTEYSLLSKAYEEVEPGSEKEKRISNRMQEIIDTLTGKKSSIELINAADQWLQPTEETDISSANIKNQPIPETQPAKKYKASKILGSEIGGFGYWGSAMPPTIPKQTKMDAAIEKEIAPQSEMTGRVEDIFKPYQNKMDAESWSELMQIMSTGDTNKLNIALKRLRERYGYIR
jgi:hypothetical protein